MKRIIIGVIAGLLVSGGVAYATIPDSGGVIHGCYDTGGNLKVIDTATTSCPKGYTALTWSQTGPQGPPGAKGDTGASGSGGIVASGELGAGACIVPTPGAAQRQCMLSQDQFTATATGFCQVIVHAQVDSGMLGVSDDGPGIFLAELSGADAGNLALLSSTGTSDPSSPATVSDIIPIQSGQSYNFGIAISSNTSNDWTGKDVGYLGHYFCWSS